MPASHVRHSLPFPFLLLILLAATACQHGSSATTPPAATQLRLSRVEYGRLVDVYGLRTTGDTTAIELYERDVVIGSDIEDERPPGSTATDASIRYDFFGSDPATLQPRLLIPRALDSAGFRDAFAALDDALREVEPLRSGQSNDNSPFPVVPRNAAIRLVFDGTLAVGDDFFVERDERGTVVGLRNTEAVRLLRIAGDADRAEALVPLPARIVVKRDAIVLDPVLLGEEGVQYETANNASGLPASANDRGANIRLALPLEGPLALPKLRPNTTELLGTDHRGLQSVVRDFRSGNGRDASSDIAGGFVRDPLPLRLIGEVPMIVDRVDVLDATTTRVTFWKNGARHDIDRGDVMRFFDFGGQLLGNSDVIADPEDDRDTPDTQFVRVLVRTLPGLASLDARQRPGYPDSAVEREAWLRQNGARASCIAEFAAGGAEGRDDPRYFLTFIPTPTPLGGVQPAANEFVSPFARAMVRFTKPVDLASLRWADTFFFATRNLTDEAAKEAFRDSLPNGTAAAGLSPAAFSDAKYRTPFLIAARVLDEDGSQTSFQLQPTVGFYLDDTMRDAPPTADFRYFLHVVADSPDGGIRDLAGNRLDLQGGTAARAASVVMPFTVDTRRNGGAPNAPDNLAVSVVCRFAARDENANPSWFLPDEVQPPDTPSRARAYPLDDLFGAYVLVDGRLAMRPTTRSRIVADNLNQAAVVQQPLPPTPPNPLGWCPQTVFATPPFPTEDQIASSSANNIVPRPIQNPLNPFGCRLQTVWREIDLSLSRTNPFDYDLDIEGMYWAPFGGGVLQFDEFDVTSLWLSHSEYRPAPCVGNTGALASLPDSGLRSQFNRNVAWNQAPTGAGTNQETQSPRVAAYVDVPLTINPATAILEPTGVNRYLPLPQFQKPYFTFRDETVMEQGGNGGIGSDLTAAAGNPTTYAYAPYVVSPFLNGQGRRWVDIAGPNGTTATFVNSYWNDAPNYRLGTPTVADAFSGGLVGAIALPLLADFWTRCDSSELPVGDPYVALGTNGWQVSVTVQSNARPNFRVFSGGRPAAAPQGGLCVDTNSLAWSTAAGGWAPGATASQPWTQTPPGDNTFYWVMLEVLRRQTVITNGFVDLLNPHRVPEGFADPRLGPFFLQGGVSTRPNDIAPAFAVAVDPPLSQLPEGTSFVPQYRAAGEVDPQPWYWNAWIANPTVLFPAPTATDPGFPAAARNDLRPSAANFPDDPLKAGDAHIRKWDTRNNRNNWTYFYNRTVTRYVEDPNQLMDPAFVEQYSTANDPFTARDIRYVNWRFVASNNTESDPPVAPSIDTFAVAWRFVHR